MILVFNNGLEDDPMPGKQMEFLKHALALKGATIHAIAESDDRANWAMLAAGVDPEWAFDCVWAAWHSAHGQVDPGQYEPLSAKAFLERSDLPLEINGKYQYGVAKKTIEAHYSEPRHWKNCRPDDWTFGAQAGEEEPE